MHQCVKVTSHGLVCKVVTVGANYHFNWISQNERDCCNSPCKATQEPCKNIVRVWIVSLVHTLGFPYATAPVSHPDWYVSPIFVWWGFAFSLDCEDDASFCHWDYLSYTVFRVFVKLGSVTYAAICCLPCMSIMCQREAGFKHIYRPCTYAFACWRCAFLIPWTARLNSFSGVCESGHRDEHADMRVAYGDAMVARERRCEDILRAETNELKIHTCATSNRFRLLRFWYTPPFTCACIGRTTLSLKTCQGFNPINEHVTTPILASNWSYSEFRTLFSFFLSFTWEPDVGRFWVTGTVIQSWA
jgi:hypothetical protein